MKLRSIFITLIVMTAGTSATRADDLSDLVATITADVTVQQISNDSKVTSLDFGKHRYKPLPKMDLDSVLLEGIFKAMKQQQFQEMLTKSYESVSPYSENREYFQDAFRPSIGLRNFFRPVPGIITSRFGWRPKFQRLHHGVDLNLQIGDTVRAALNGTIERISYDYDGYGHYVVVSHNDGMETLYGHLQYALVAQGQTIRAGQPLGIGGNTGNSTGPHLHFEARLGGVAVDPLLIFDFYGMASYYTEEYRNTQSSKVPVYSHQSKSLANEPTYIVRYGDTPESVARQAGISVMRLRQLNMLNEGDRLTVGRMLKLK